MSTLRLTATQHDLELAAELLTSGKLVAFPTETVYGLGASITHPTAIQHIFQAKGRPSDNPLIVHVASLEQALNLTAELTPTQLHQLRTLANTFWPGPLTVLLPKNNLVSDQVTANQPTVAIRWPDHPVAQRLIELTDTPIAAPSANTSGKPSPTTAQHVLDDLSGKIAAVIDDGPTSIGIESTVLDLTATPPRILRPGHITRQQLVEALNTNVEELLLPSTQELTKPVTSPGMKYRHYAPAARVVILEDNQLDQLNTFFPADTVILTNIKHDSLAAFTTHPLTATTLFAEFRQADHDGLSTIVIITDPEIRHQTGLMNRIAKAAAG